MVVLDTNVISELMRPAPDETVLRWVARQRLSTLFTTSICQAEIFDGIARLPEGRRRASLAAGAERLFRVYFVDRILAFDADAAPHYAAILTLRRRAGRPITTCDALIAATVSLAGVAVATRSITDFEGCGIEVIDPWRAA